MWHLVTVWADGDVSLSEEYVSEEVAMRNRRQAARELIDDPEEPRDPVELNELLDAVEAGTHEDFRIRVVEAPKKEIPGILKDSMRGGLGMQRSFFRDYSQCLKEKAIADRACKTWDETVERSMGIAVLYGRMLASAENIAPELLTPEERDW